MIAPDETVPDLLRRFVPTPHHRNLVLRGIPLSVHTNDLDLLDQIQSASRAPEAEVEPALLLKMIRDHDVVTDGIDTTILSSGPLVTFIVGGRSIIVLDCERREILGFLSASLGSDLFINELLPNLLAHFSSAQMARSSPLSTRDGNGFSQKSDNSEIAP